MLKDLKDENGNRIIDIDSDTVKARYVRFYISDGTATAFNPIWPFLRCGVYVNVPFILETYDPPENDRSYFGSNWNLNNRDSRLGSSSGASLGNTFNSNSNQLNNYIIMDLSGNKDIAGIITDKYHNTNYDDVDEFTVEYSSDGGENYTPHPDFKYTPVTNSTDTISQSQTEGEHGRYYRYRSMYSSSTKTVSPIVGKNTFHFPILKDVTHIKFVPKRPSWWFDQYKNSNWL